VSNVIGVAAPTTGLDVAALRVAAVGPPAMVLGFARLPEHRIAEAVGLLDEAAATRVGRAH
jgi:hypothetical protein